MQSFDFKLEQIFEVIPAHIYWLDRNNIYQGCNTLQAKACGFNSRDEIVGKSNKDFTMFEPALIAEYDRNNIEVMESGIAKIVQETTIVAGGRYTTVLSHKLPLRDAQGHIIGLLGISLDITDLKKRLDTLETKIEQTDLPLEHILAHMPGHLYWKNKEGVYLGCNDSQAQTLGMACGKHVIGKTDFDLPWGKELADKYRDNDLRIINSGIGERVEETGIFNGKEVVYLSFKTPLKNKNGDIIGILGISIDITKQKEAERKLIAAKEAAELANLAKTEFLENMRHDIRTPLSGIVGLSELLNNEFDKDKIKEYTHELKGASQELLRFLNEVLESINVASGKIPLLKKKFDLRETLESLIKLHKPKALEKSLDLQLSIDPSIPRYLIGDPVRIYRICLELLVNALKFTKEGHVKITVIIAKKKKREIVIQIFVKDTGPGIPLEKQQDLFVRFNRLTPSYQGIYKGAGLGLSIVKQFIDDLEGEIYVESGLNIGTKFVCVIPLRVALLDQPFAGDNIINNINSPLKNNESVNVEIKSSSEEGKLKGVVLVVEDQPVAALVANKLLEQQGYKVEVVETGKDALDKVRQYKYDFILMDIGLPDINGYEITEEVRAFENKLNNKICIIGLTAHLDAERERRGLEAGMNFIFSKPLTNEIIFTITTALASGPIIQNKFLLGPTESKMRSA